MTRTDEILTPDGVTLPEVPEPVIEHCVQFELLYAELVAALDALATTSDQRSGSASSDTVLFEAADGVLTATTADYHSRTTIRLGRIAKTDGALAVRFGEIRKLLAALAKGRTKRDVSGLVVEVAGVKTTSFTQEWADRWDTSLTYSPRFREYTGKLAEARAYAADLTTDGYRLPLETTDAGAFPPSPELHLEHASTVSVDRLELLDVLGRVVPSAGTDDTLPGLTGVLLLPEAGRLTVFATNRYRVVGGTVAATGDLPMSVPARFTTISARLLLASVKKMTNEQVTLVLSADGDLHSVVTDGTTTLVVSNLTGEERITKFFDEVADTTIEVDRAGLTELVVRATAISRAKLDKDAKVMVLVEGGAITPIPTLGDLRRPAEIAAPSLPAEVRGVHEDVLMMLDPAYLSATLQVLRSERAVLGLSGGDAAAYVKPLLVWEAGGSSYRQPGWLGALVMPIRFSRWW